MHGIFPSTPSRPIGTGGDDRQQHHDSTKAGRAVPSRNPLPLSNAQEAQVRERYLALVRETCADEIRAFAECATGRTFTVAFACKKAQRLMNHCTRTNSTNEQMDRAREEWFAERVERQKKRERTVRRAELQEDFIRQWWNMPEADPKARRRMFEALQRQERVGGFRARGGVQKADSSAEPSEGANGSGDRP